ncbi:MAG: VCBS repeat-containing protein [Ardenticatenales bacterium]|nr:VCBS repeat-containing protein [Ardenticatenales bacterium]
MNQRPLSAKRRRLVLLGICFLPLYWLWQIDLLAPSGEMAALPMRAASPAQAALPPSPWVGPTVPAEAATLPLLPRLAPRMQNPNNVAAAVSLDPATVWTSADVEESYSAAWGDVDGDGDLDLAVGNSPISGLGDGFGGQNVIYRNDNGVLQSEGNIWRSRNAAYTRSVAWGDVDGDGDLDLAVGNGCDYADEDCGRNEVYLNQNGRLHGEPAWESEEFDNTTSVAWGDADGDGDLDLAVGNDGGPNRMYMNENGKLQRQALCIFGDDRIHTFSLAWGNMDADSGLVLAAGNFGSNKLYAYENGCLQEIWDSQDNESTRSVAWGDMDGDGDLDLAAANWGRDSKIYRNQDHVLQSATDTPAPVTFGGNLSYSVAWGDVDGDGDLDLALGNDDSRLEIYLYQDGVLQRFPWTAGISHEKFKRRTRVVTWGDVDGDGDLDLAVANILSNDSEFLGTNLVYYNQGSLLSRVAEPWDDSGVWLRSPAWEDIDGDRHPELTISNTPGNTGAVHSSGANVVYLNDNGDIHAFTFPGENANTRAIAWGDVDGDGDIDLALGNWGPANRVYFNDGHQLQAARSWASTEADLTLSVAWGDVDGDGDLDLAVGNDGANAVYLYQNGALLPTASWRSNDADETNSIAWGDVDGDGDLDLAAGNINGGAKKIYLNQGGVLQSEAAWVGERDATELTWGDVDDDGDLDLITSSYGRGFLFRNNRQGQSGRVNEDPTLTVNRPTPAGSVDFFAPPPVETRTIISLTYTLWDQESDRIGRIAGQYSLNGGGQWFPAVAAGGTVTQNLPADGTARVFLWNTFASGFVGQSDNVVFRLLAYPRPPTETAVITGTYRYTNTTSGGLWQRPFVVAQTPPFAVRGTQIVVTQRDGQPAVGAVVYNKTGTTLSAAILRDNAGIPYTTNEDGILQGRAIIRAGDQLVALWPVPTETQQLSTTLRIPFAGNYTLFFSSSPPTETGLAFTPVAAEGGLLPLTVSHRQPLLLFHLNVSLEWDARQDELFLRELEQSFRQAATLLYDVSNGQVALGQINLFHDKAYWGQSDILIYADNGLRPSAAIGGIISQTVADPGNSETGHAPVPDAYLPGSIRMGTVWDPYGERTADLGEEWTRALAHELAHYLLFLPDNYLGFKGEAENVLGRINCPDSFMTSSSDPTYSEFLTPGEWQDRPACLTTLANVTTGRSDWATITRFYPMLFAPPEPPLNGPANLPLDVTYVLPWRFNGAEMPLASRNFDIRTDDGRDGRLRLPNAQAYLFHTNVLTDTTDDVLIPLGAPTGGGDRLKVRGAAPGDRVCVFDNGLPQAYTGCIANITADTVAIRAAARAADWQPQILVRPVTSRTIALTVTQPITDGERPRAQLFPMHYGAIPGNAVSDWLVGAGEVYTQNLTMRMPAFEIAVRVWIADENGLPDGSGRETIAIFHLTPPDWGPFNLPDDLRTTATPTYAPIGGPNNVPTGGPNNVPTGGPNNVPTGGPNNVPIGGPNNVPTGGPNNVPTGGPNNVPTGGVSGSFNAPIVSADAQVAIYRADGFFADNGVASLQVLAAVPDQAAYPWLLPVGPAYRVQNRPDVTGERFISFVYLQRDVPEGYENTLAVYFKADGVGRPWRRITETQQFVENLVVAPLQTDDAGAGIDGVYAVMASVEMPALQPGWNLLAYPLTVSRPLTSALAAIAGQYDGNRVWLAECQPKSPDCVGTQVNALKLGHAYWIYITASQSVTLYLAPPVRRPDGTLQ